MIASPSSSSFFFFFFLFFSIAYTHSPSLCVLAAPRFADSIRCAVPALLPPHMARKLAAPCRPPRLALLALVLLLLLLLLLLWLPLVLRTPPLFAGHRQRHRGAALGSNGGGGAARAACDAGVWAPWQQGCGRDGLRSVGRSAGLAARGRRAGGRVVQTETAAAEKEDGDLRLHPC